MTQAPSSVVLIRPSQFAPNPATAADNAFQSVDSSRSASTLAADAYAEATAVASALRDNGVTVHVFADEDNSRPDSVFPNNWFSAMPDGRIAIFPMFSPSRRGERRPDVIDTLRVCYRVDDVVDYSGLEADEVYLEGTGAMVLDHRERVAYVARSNRANPVALQRFCETFGYSAVLFDAVDDAGVPVYHTNVLMCVATDFALVGLQLIRDPVARAGVERLLRSSGRDVIALSLQQIRDFAGNALEVTGRDGRLLVMSARASASLTSTQRAQIERHVPIVAVDVPTIELAGGSVRCMIAGIHLPGLTSPVRQAEVER